MTAVDDLALFGGRPRFPALARRGGAPAPQLAEALGGIFARRYFANHGPLVRCLDQQLAATFGVRHAICAGNGPAAVMVTLRALAGGGTVAFPALGRGEDFQAIGWAGSDALVFDAGSAAEATLSLPAAAMLAGLEPGIAGRGAHPRLVTMASGAIDLLHDGFGSAAILVFDDRCLVGGADSACILTNDDGLAADLRARRAFHAADTAPDLRLNGKMSEGQAAVVLADLAALPQRRTARQATIEAYRRSLATMSGATLLPDGLTLELGADAGIAAPVLARLLRAEGLACAVPRLLSHLDPADFPHARRRTTAWLALPDRPDFTDADGERMRALFETIFRHAGELVARVGEHA